MSEFNGSGYKNFDFVVSEFNSNGKNFVVSGFNVSEYKNINGKNFDRLILKLNDISECDKETLSEIYHDMVWYGIHQYEYGKDQEEKPIILNKLLPLFTEYLKIDDKSARPTLQYFAKFSTRYVNLNSVKVLIYLKQYDEMYFEERANHVIGSELSNFIKIFSHHPELNVNFANSSLSMDRIIVDLMARIRTLKEWNDAGVNEESAFKSLLEFGVMWHGEHQEIIASSLYNALLLRKSLYREYITLLSSNVELLRVKSKEALLTFLSQSKDDFWCEYIVKDIMETSIQMYNELNVALQNNIVPLQKFWMLLDNAKLTNSFISQYFNDHIFNTMNSGVNNEVNNAMNVMDDDWVQTLNACLKRAEFNTIVSFVDAAGKSGLDKHISSKFIISFRLKYIFTENLDLKVRVSFLDTILSAITQKVLSEFKTSFNEEMVNSPFKRYALLVLSALDESKTSYENFAYRREISEMTKTYPELKESDAVRNKYGRLFNGINKYKDTPHISIDQQFHHPKLTGVMFGYSYDQNGFLLYACDEVTGDAIWCSSKFMKKENAYFITKDKVYVAQDNGDINILAVNTGYTIDVWKIDDKEIKYIGVIGDVCYIVYKGEISITKDGININKVTYNKLGGSDFFIVGNKLCRFYHPNNAFYFYDVQGVETTLNTNSDLMSSLTHVVAENKLYLHFDNTLFCYNSEVNEYEWKRKIEFRVKQIVVHSNRIYLLSRTYELVAIEGAEEIWHISTERKDGFIREEIDEILISHDGKIIYGIHSSLGDLYTFDSDTGVKQSLYKVNEGRIHHLLGTSVTGKLYILPISY